MMANQDFTKPGIRTETVNGLQHEIEVGYDGETGLTFGVVRRYGNIIYSSPLSHEFSNGWQACQNYLEGLK